MNMNREAVNTALGLAGNQPLTVHDKLYKNSVYVLCRRLYLPTLFSCLTEVDWRCARKWAHLDPSETRTARETGRYYYDLPADCIRPLHVDDNRTGFLNDTSYIITDAPVSKLYYVFHRRKFTRRAFDALDGDREDAVVLKRPVRPEDVAGARLLSRAGSRAEEKDTADNDDDFPEWEYTPCDADVWDYFSYKLAAAMVPSLRVDDGAAQRVQSLEALAAAKGEKAVQRSRQAEANTDGGERWWAERCGLAVGYGGRNG